MVSRMAACVVTVYGMIVLIVVQLSLVSASGHCQGAVQTVTNLRDSQTAAAVVYQALRGKRIVRRE